MAIRKPSMSVEEAKRLAIIRSAAAGQFVDPVVLAPPPPPRLESSSPAPRSSAVQAPSASEGLTSTPAVNFSSSASALPLSVGAPPPDAKVHLSESRPTSRLTVSPSPSLASARSARVQVFLSAPLPAPGVSAVFEILCRQYPPQKALQMILRKALDDYEEMLGSGSFQKSPAIYARDEASATGSIIQTSRMIPKALVAIARAHFDPLGLESTRAFGRKLATAAVAAFFAHEVKRHI